MTDELVEGIDYYIENGFMVFTRRLLAEAWILLPFRLPPLPIRICS